MLELIGVGWNQCDPPLPPMLQLRGQTVFDLECDAGMFRKLLAKLMSWCSPQYVCTVILCLIIHVSVMSVRASYRECTWKGVGGSDYNYASIDYPMCVDRGRRQQDVDHHHTLCQYFLGCVATHGVAAGFRCTLGLSIEQDRLQNVQETYAIFATGV